MVCEPMTMMRTAAALMVTLLVSGGSAFSASPAASVSEVTALEIRLWEAWHHHDLKAWSELTAPEYEWTDGKDRSGYADVRRTFDLGQLQEYRLGKINAFVLRPDEVALSYRAFQRGIYRNKPFQQNFTEFSLWEKRGGKWRNVLLQEVQMSPGKTIVKPPDGKNP